MGTVRMNPKRLNDSERKLWIDNDEYLYNWSRKSPLSITKFIKKYKVEIDNYINGNLSHNITVGKFRNPLTLPKTRSLMDASQGTVRLNPLDSTDMKSALVLLKILNKEELNSSDQFDLMELVSNGYVDYNNHNEEYEVTRKGKTRFGIIETTKRKMKKSKSKSKNPLHHYPKTAKGRLRKVGRPKSNRASHLFPRGKGRLPQVKFFMLDLYNSSGKLTNTLIGQGTIATAKLEAEQFSHKQGISRVELSGPYSKRPTKSTPRI